MVRNAGDLHRAKQRAAANGQKLTEEEEALWIARAIGGTFDTAPVDKAEDESGREGKRPTAR